MIEDEFVLTERACACFAKQILEGVAHMHERRVVHLDLKPENILCLTRAGNRVKIIDFGLARKYEPEKKLQVRETQRQQIETTAAIETISVETIALQQGDVAAFKKGSI